MESQEPRGSKDPREPRGRKEPKDLPGLLKYPTYWGTKESQASKGLQDSRVRKETEAFLGSRVWKDAEGHLDHQGHQAPEEILEAMGILENRAQGERREAWGTWGCQGPKERGELWDSQVSLEKQASQVFMVPKEIRVSRVIQKAQGQDRQDPRENQDCQVPWE